MARAPRLQTPYLIRHVMARGNGRMTIFLDDGDYREFTHLLGDVVERFRIECWNYCLMPNHYHATLQPTLPNLSKAIQQLNARYGQWWNRRHSRVGHVFQGRYKDQSVQKDGYLLRLSHYVIANPVRAGLARQPGDWAWSSYLATAGGCDAPSFLACSKTLGLFGDGSRAELQARFREFAASTPDDPTSLDRFRSSERIVGNADFKREVEGRSIPTARPDNEPKAGPPSRTDAALATAGNRGPRLGGA